MLLNFGRTKSPGRSSHEIREWLASVVGKTHRNASANLFWAFDMSALRLIDTCSGSPNCHYVNRVADALLKATRISIGGGLRRDAFGDLVSILHVLADCAEGGII